MVDQLVDVLQFFDALLHVAEQVIEVPKIIIEHTPPRTSVREPQLAEQLVEVPTILCFLKQKVDIPVLRALWRRLQGFCPGQGSTAPPFSEQVWDIPVPGGGLQGFRPGQGSAAIILIFSLSSWCTCGRG